MVALLGGLLGTGCPGSTGGPDPTARARAGMVDRQIVARGVKDERVLAVLREVPRHLFVPPDQAAQAYDDHPLPIGSGQTISQPYVVAFMSEQLRLTGTEKVLEIGTGSGYQTAVLSRLAARVFSIEIRPELAASAESLLGRLGIGNVHVRAADGYHGWAEAAPFD
ncbi:partial Protein-L-isoaspartate O-methyltransferase, partial [Gammaproteobacteria bacterium]